MSAGADACGHLRRYDRVDRARAGRVWAEAYEAAAQKRSGPGVRVRVLYMISGLVLPVWQEVKRVLAAQPRPAERRLSVIRLETTGALVSTKNYCRYTWPWRSLLWCSNVKARHEHQDFCIQISQSF